MSIVITNKGQNAKVIDPTGFPKEDELQAYVHDNPESIPLQEIKDGLRLFVACREFPTQSGPIDALGFDKEGGIYIIETKLYKNADKRQVVAQALDYGAALWNQFSGEDFLEALINRCNDFKDHAIAFFELDDVQIEEMLDGIRRNINEGKIRFIILMDKVEERLKNMIQYINQNSRFDILGVQFEYYKTEICEILIPKLYGAEVRKEVGSRSSESSTSTRHSWTRNDFETAILNLEKHQQNVIGKLLNFVAIKTNKFDWGTGVLPVLNYKVFLPQMQIARLVFSVWANGQIQIGYWVCRLQDQIPAIKIFCDNVEKIDGITISKKRTDNFELTRQAEQWVDEFLKIVDKLTNDLQNEQ